MADPAPELCLGCVYFPPNLPREAYSESDWQELQAKRCSFDCAPGDAECQGLRKTECTLVDLREMGADGD